MNIFKDNVKIKTNPISKENKAYQIGFIKVILLKNLQLHLLNE